MKNSIKGFTIVELLIVIVVIAILAAISIVAYNGIQDRARNNTTIQGAKSLVKLINSYVIQNGAYPSTGNLCLTTDNNCVDNPSSNTALTGDNTSLMTNISTIGTPPKSAPLSPFGYRYSYSSTRTVNGEPNRAFVMAFLKGTSLDCGGGTVVAGTSPDFIDSTTGFTQNGAGYTYCYYKLASPFNQ